MESFVRWFYLFNIAQAQDRAHRIGQVRDVHIYRFITSHTIEDNILKKANRKRALDNLVIQDGQFNTDFFKKVHWSDWLGVDVKGSADAPELSAANFEKALRSVEDEADVIAGRNACKEITGDKQDFSEVAVVEKDVEALDGIDNFMFTTVIRWYGFQESMSAADFVL